MIDSYVEGQKVLIDAVVEHVTKDGDAHIRVNGSQHLGGVLLAFSPSNSAVQADISLKDF